jgi:hypothetical protein
MTKRIDRAVAFQRPACGVTFAGSGSLGLSQKIFAAFVGEAKSMK